MMQNWKCKDISCRANADSTSKRPPYLCSATWEPSYRLLPLQKCLARQPHMAAWVSAQEQHLHALPKR